MKKTEKKGIFESNTKLVGGILIGLAAATAGVVVWSVFFKKATVLGKVTDAGGQPLEGVQVTLAGYEEGTSMTTTTAADGTFQFPGGATVSYIYQGYFYYYYYDLSFVKAGYQTVTHTGITLHPAGNTFNAVMEAM